MVEGGSGGWVVMFHQKRRREVLIGGWNRAAMGVYIFILIF